MKKMQFIQKGILALLVVATALVGCSKDSDSESNNKPKTPAHLSNWQPKPVVDTTQPYMSFLTKSTNTLTVQITPATASSTVWIDTNNNGVFDEGTDVRITNTQKSIVFSAPSKVFTIYGAVKQLNAMHNKLTAADVRSNPALNKLNIANNELAEEALLKLVQHLPTPTNGAAVVLRNAQGDSNVVTPAVREAVEQKGWKPLRLNSGKEQEDKGDQDPTPGTIIKDETDFDMIALEWTEATDDVTPKQQLRYQVMWKSQNETKPNSSPMLTNKLNYTITKLQPNTSYDVWVVVYNSINRSKAYPTKTIETSSNPNNFLEKNNYIELVTSFSKGSTIEVYIDPIYGNDIKIWIDLDADGIYESNQDIRVKGHKLKHYLKVPIIQGKIRVYGDIAKFECNNNGLTSLKISESPSLQELEATENRLTYFDASQNTQLHKLYLYDNYIQTFLPTSSLKDISLASNQKLKSLDFSNLNQLKRIHLSGCNSLSSLTIGANQKLTILFVDRTALNYLDISSLPKLQDLYLHNTNIKNIRYSTVNSLKVVEFSNSNNNGFSKATIKAFIRVLSKEGGHMTLSQSQVDQEIIDDLEKINWKLTVVD